MSAFCPTPNLKGRCVFVKHLAQNLSGMGSPMSSQAVSAQSLMQAGSLTPMNVVEIPSRDIQPIASFANLQVAEERVQSTRLRLELHAGSPVILLPVSFQSPQIMVADLGKLSIKNAFHYSGSEGTISSVRQQSKSAESSCDKTQLSYKIHHGNCFTVTRYSHSVKKHFQMLTYSSLVKV